MTAIVDKELIRKSLKELILTNPDFVREILLEIQAELKIAHNEQFEKILVDIFKEYDAVLRALA